MKKLKIEYKGGFRQVSKHLTHEHDANFALIIDAMVYIYNENIDNLMKIGNKVTVKISNGFLSRQTGLTLNVIKRNVEKIEGIGLITALKKGQGNTRHYVIHIKQINTYINALEGRFTQWYDDSIESSKKDMSRSKEADKIKLDSCQKNFERTMAEIALLVKKPTIKLVENQPTQTLKTNQANRTKSTVVNTTIETSIETTTVDKTKSVVVTRVFNEENENGKFHKINEENIVYQEEYENYLKQYSKEELENIHYKMQEEYNGEILVIDDFDPRCLDDDWEPSTENVKTKDEDGIDYSTNKIMWFVYEAINDTKRIIGKEIIRKFETTSEPAQKEISQSNWKKLEKAYSDLPDIPNQGKFYVGRKDKEDFFNFSEFRQKWIIESVQCKRSGNSTASRPAIYIEEANKTKLRKHSDCEKKGGRVNIAL